MFSYLFLNPNIYNEKQRKEKLKNLSINNVIFKNGFNGFNYNYLKKEELFKKENTERFKLFLEGINIPVYELLGYNLPTKFYLDCEMENISKDIFDKKDELFLSFDKYLLKFLNDKFPQKEKSILYADSSRMKNGNYKLSIHVIVNNLGYFDRIFLKKLILEFINSLPKETFFKNGKSFVDDSVYKGSQLMRIIYSHNLSKDSILKPFVIENNKITYKDILFLSENYHNSLCGKYTDTDDEIIGINEEIINNVNKVKNVNNINNDYNIIIPSWKIKWVENNKYIKNIYKINNICGNKINLLRIRSNANCKLCKRSHDSDNAYCKVYKNNIIFYCNRNNKGKSIGSWYDNYINNSDNNLDNNLIEENIKLKEKIKELEETIMNLKTINKIVPHKNTTHKNISNNNIFVKYYEVGKLIFNDNIVNIKNIISQYWSDGNISKIKNRCLRIYKIFEYMKNNNIQNIKCSLRSIFHSPEWKFDENLKNNIFF